MRVEGKRNEVLPCFLREPKGDENKPAPGLPPQKTLQTKQNKKTEANQNRIFIKTENPKCFGGQQRVAAA